MPNLDQSEAEFRYRLKDPGLFLDGSFQTKEIEQGLRVIIGKLSGEGSTVAQSIRFDKKSWDRSKAMTWVDSHKEDFTVTAQELFSVKDVEIFSTGCWNGKEITEADLENMVQAFSATKSLVRPFLKLGHDDTQKLLQNDGLPAAGWVECQPRNGSKLAADFVDIPKKIYQLLKNKAYRNVSCEVYSNIKLQDVDTYPKMLGAVSLLGSDMPAVMNLNDILSLYGLDQNFSSVEKFTTPETVDTIITNEISHETQKDDVKMPDAKLEFKLEESENKNKSLADQIAAQSKEIDKFKTDLQVVTDLKAEADKKVIDALQKEKAAGIDLFVSEITAEKLCSKAMQPLIKDLLAEDKEKYSVGDKEVSKAELLKEILKFSKEASKVNFEDTTANEKDGDKPDVGAQIEKYAKDNGVSYTDAYRAVTRKD